MCKILPKLRDEVLKYSVAISEMDLRWGITENESKLGRVLQICLGEVDNAMLFFYRYNW